MKNSLKTIAVIDIGSNSVRLFIFRITGGAAEQISALKVFCGLGKDLGTTGLLNPDSVTATHEALANFRAEIGKYDIETEIVVGTASLREARDAAAFTEDVRRGTGFEIRIIDGEEEARLAALAILSSDPLAAGVVADFGGGSLELAKIGGGRIERTISLKLGAHYLKALPDREAGIGEVLEPALAAHPDLMAPPVLYVIGGSWRSLAKAWLQDKEMTADLDGLGFKGADILPFCRQMRNRDPIELAARYRMEGPRAELMDVSALMLHALIETLRPELVKVSTSGIRDGLAYDYILNHKAA